MQQGLASHHLGHVHPGLDDASRPHVRRLKLAVVDVLRKPQYWDGFDKGRMRDIPIQFVARNAVGDACHTFALCEMLHGRLDRGDYMTWRK